MQVSCQQTSRVSQDNLRISYFQYMKISYFLRLFLLEKSLLNLQFSIFVFPFLYVKFLLNQ